VELTIFESGLIAFKGVATSQVYRGLAVGRIISRAKQVIFLSGIQWTLFSNQISPV
jgi:hypothetical protein